MRRPVRIALGQLAAVPGDLDANIKQTVNCIATAGRQHTDLLVLPELCATGVMGDIEVLRQLAEAADGSGRALQAWQEAARVHNVAVVAGFAERDGSNLYNSAIAIDRGGAVRGCYRKLHLFAGERQLFQPGDSGFSIVELDGYTLGMLICYDLRFPEALRLLALEGADVVAVPAAWVHAFDHPAETESSASVEQVRGVLVQANLSQVFVACADAVGDVPAGLLAADGQRFLGRSLVADPYGRASIGPAPASSETVVIAEIDLADIGRARHRGGGIEPQRERRTDAYTLVAGDGRKGRDPYQSEEEVLAHIERERGYLLDFHRTLARYDPPFLHAYDNFMNAAYLRAGVLDRRTKELIYVGVLTALPTEDAHLEAHMRAALTHGSTPREIIEVLEQVLPPAGVPRFLAALRVFEQLTAETV